jgi:hypothetical protein
MFSQSGSNDILYTIYHASGLSFLNPEVGNYFVEDFIGTMPTGEK